MVRAHPTVPDFNDLADRPEFLALFWLGGEVIWGRREFRWADYAPYQDRLGKLLTATPNRYREFMMFSVEKSTGVSDVYVGVPFKELMPLFDGFENLLAVRRAISPLPASTGA